MVRSPSSVFCVRLHCHWLQPLKETQMMRGPVVLDQSGSGRHTEKIKRMKNACMWCHLKSIRGRMIAKSLIWAQHPLSYSRGKPSPSLGPSAKPSSGWSCISCRENMQWLRQSSSVTAWSAEADAPNVRNQDMHDVHEQLTNALLFSNGWTPELALTRNCHKYAICITQSSTRVS